MGHADIQTTLPAICTTCRARRTRGWWLKRSKPTRQPRRSLRRLGSFSGSHGSSHRGLLSLPGAFPGERVGWRSLARTGSARRPGGLSASRSRREVNGNSFSRVGGCLELCPAEGAVGRGQDRRDGLMEGEQIK